MRTTRRGKILIWSTLALIPLGVGYSIPTPDLTTSPCAADERWVTNDGYGGDCVSLATIHDHGYVHPTPIYNSPCDWPELSDAEAEGECGDYTDYWGTYDGHDDCWALVGDTSYIWCRDGFRTTS